MSTSTDPPTRPGPAHGGAAPAHRGYERPGRPVAPADGPVAPTAWVAMGLSGAGFIALLWAWTGGGFAVDLPWAPTWGVRLAFRLDGLGALYGLLATGIGFAVFAYSAGYLRRHLNHQGRPAADERSFYALMLLFMASMVGLATTEDLLLLFVFWDLTAIASYFLIGYDRHETDSWSGALMALLVTGISAVLLLIAVVLLRVEYGTFSLPVIVDRLEPGGALTAAAALIMVAGLAKSAQMPLHFWLPRAMAAPTPVSAYLHSAAMVAAGVLLIGRAYPLIVPSRELLDAMLVVGLVSMYVAGVIALTRDRLKQVLAYSTIAQYGYVVTLYGAGGEAGATAAGFYVLAHAVVKSALFMAAGAVTEATGGESRLSCLGGLRRSMPATALAAGVAAAGLGALPLTVGFFKDELLFKAALERGPAVAVLVVGGAALTVAYIGRFWLGLFTGPQRRAGARLPIAFTAPPLALALIALATGVVATPFERLAAAAAEWSTQAPASVAAAYYLDLRLENVMALAAYAGGALLIATRRRWAPAAEAVALAGVRVGPERLYVSGLRRLNRLSDAIHTFELRDLRTRVTAVLLPCGLLVGVALVAVGGGSYSVGRLGTEDLSLALPLVVAAVAAVATTFPRRHLGLVLVLSGTGFCLAVVYAFFGAPDVALVAVLVETLFALLFVAVFSLVPGETLRREAALPETASRRRRDLLVGVVAGTFAFLLVWGALSGPAPAARGVAGRIVELAPDAHAKDVVTAILSDFRGLDTLVEVTVLVVALVGMRALLAPRRTA